MTDKNHSRLRGREWLLITLILLTGFALRVAHFSDVPPGVIHDEVRNWLNIQLIYEGDIRPLYPYGGGREALYLFIQAISFRLIGVNLLAARFPSLAFGMIGMAISSWLRRESGVMTSQTPSDESHNGATTRWTVAVSTGAPYGTPCQVPA